MKGAIFYSGKYGSTEQYSYWIAEATDLPVFHINDPNADPTQYDYVILGSSIIYFKLSIRHWVKSHLSELEDRTKILFSVSGAGPSDKLNRWVNKSLPQRFLSRIHHFALRGKLDHSKVSWWVKFMLWMGALFNPNPEASKDERYGFDYMDQSSIDPIVILIKSLQSSKMTDEP